jgi:recombination protein RecT
MSTALVAPKEALAALTKGLEAARSRILAVIPPTMSVDRVLAVVQNEFARNPYLRECAPDSIVRGVVQAAELGLDLSPKLGQAFLIPRGKKKGGNWIKVAELQIGYKGILKKAYECDRILSVDAVPVHEGDRFEIHRGTHPDVLHDYAPSDERAKRPITCLYFAARLTPHEGNVWRVDDMAWSEIEAIRDRSDGYKAFRAGRSKSTPWVDNETEMARKTMLVRGLKTCPISDSFRSALEADADDYKGARATGDEKPSRAEDLKSKLGIPSAPTEIAEAEFEEGEP